MSSSSERSTSQGCANPLEFAPPKCVFICKAANDVLTITGENGPLVVIDLKTGAATLHGDPNEAARIFWRSVEAQLGSRTGVAA